MRLQVEKGMGKVHEKRARERPKQVRKHLSELQEVWTKIQKVLIRAGEISGPANERWTYADLISPPASPETPNFRWFRRSRARETAVHDGAK